jgi:type II secretory pathway component GspD/PulD (secretin)
VRTVTTAVWMAAFLTAAAAAWADGPVPDLPADLAARTVSLDVRDLDLRSALNLIAQQHNLNIVSGDEVSGTVTGHFDGVPLGEVLDSLTRSCGCRLEQVGDVIVVTRIDEGVPRGGITRVIPLHHADARLARTAVAKILSPRGSICLFPDSGEGEGASAAEKVGPEATRLIVHDEASRVDEVARVVAELDRAPRQLMIEVRLVETVLGNGLNLGLDWNPVGTVKGNKEDQDLPLDRDRFRFGTLSLKEFQVMLEMLDEDNNSRLISNPRITAEENQEARISVGTIFPVRTVSRFSEAGITQDLLTYEDKEINIELSVTPRVDGDSLITLMVNPTVEDIIGWTGEYEDQPITSKRNLETRVTLRDGETVAMGGLIKETEIEKVHRVWLLGRIPILGRLLFTHTSRTKEKTDMLVFITPHLLATP